MSQIKITRISAIALTLIFLVSAAPLQAQDQSGGPLSRLAGRIRSHWHSPRPETSHAAPAAVPIATATAQSPSAAGYECATGSDPYGFAAILNRIRAAAGLHPVVYDPELSSWASRNNAEQCRRGLGHHIFPCAMQNCGWNYPDAASAAEGWMNSPGHRVNMLSPTITRFGIAFGPGPYWTLNGR